MDISLETRFGTNALFNPEVTLPSSLSFIEGLLEESNYVIGVSDTVTSEMMTQAATRFGAYVYGKEDEDSPLWEWVIPTKRAVLLPRHYHVSKTTKYQYRKSSWTLDFNFNFGDVVRLCAEVERSDNDLEPGYSLIEWLDYETQEAYGRAFRKGDAYCVSVWNSDYQIVGGLFGLWFKDFLTVDSMFFRESGASKAALDLLQQWAFQKAGMRFIDLQEHSEHLASLGATEVDADTFNTWLASCDRSGQSNQCPAKCRDLVHVHELLTNDVYATPASQ